MQVLKLNSENFEKEVLNESKLVLVDFYADWCGPCKMMAPIVEKIAEKASENVKICKINVDEASEIASKYGVMSIPTFIVFKNGEPEKITVGMQPEENLKEMLEM